ncbi:uncharacterized protein BDV14DRAFT_109368 [Aspergillus stella-maris]|uniref:uncharacterized protein n=1 Tax=Aspergillus stella-maris TaxID=1810926 RepID=UPI003CCE3824
MIYLAISTEILERLHCSIRCRSKMRKDRAHRGTERERVGSVQFSSPSSILSSSSNFPNNLKHKHNPNSSPDSFIIHFTPHQPAFRVIINQQLQSYAHASSASLNLGQLAPAARAQLQPSFPGVASDQPAQSVGVRLRCSISSPVFHHCFKDCTQAWVGNLKSPGKRNEPCGRNGDGLLLLQACMGPRIRWSLALRLRGIVVVANAGAVGLRMR